VYAYLLSTLPGFGIDDPPPMPLSELLARCRGFVTDDELAALTDPEAAAEASVGGPEAAVARAWRDGERQLANALARRRASFWGMAPGESGRDREHRGFLVMIEEAVARAYESGDPMTRERALDGLRWALLDELSGPVPWGFAALFAYAQRLRIGWRWAGREPAAGREILGRILDHVEARGNQDANGAQTIEEHHG